MSLRIFRPQIPIGRATKGDQRKARKKRTSYIWYAEWTASGRTHRKSLGTKNRDIAGRLAKKLEENLLLQKLGLAPKPAEPIEVKQTKWDYLVERFVKRYPKKTTSDEYESSLRVFHSFAKPAFASEVNYAMIDGFITKYRTERKPSNFTINAKLRTLKSFLNWALRSGEITQVPPFEGLFQPEPKLIPKVVKASNLEAFLTAIPKVTTPVPAEWWSLMFCLLETFGLRRGEALALTWAKVDLETGVLFVEADTSKGLQDKEFPLTTELIARLSRWKAEQGESELVFPWPLGIRAFTTYRTKIEKAAGCKVRPKDLRSTAGTALTESGSALNVTQAILGHSSPTVTAKHYAGVPLEVKREALEARELRKQAKAAKAAASAAKVASEA